MIRKIKDWCIKRLGGISQIDCVISYNEGLKDAYQICLEYAENNLFGLSGDEWSAQMYNFLKDAVEKY